MAEGESIIETVSVKFRVLEDSLQALKDALAKANQAVVDSTDDTNKKVIKSHEDTEDVLDKIRETHLDKASQMRIREQRAIYEMHERQKDWLKERQDIDLSTKYNMMQAEQNAMDQSLANIDKIKQGYGGLKATIDEVGKAIGINLGQLATTATMVTAIFTAFGEADIYKRNKRSFEAIRGRKFSDSEAKVYQEWLSNTTSKGFGGMNVSMEEARRVGSGLMGISPGLTDPTDIFKKGGLADTALYAAPGAGVSTDKALEHFRDMISHLRMSSNAVSEEFMKLVQTSRQMNDTSGRYIDTTINLAKNFTAYNLDVDTAGKIVRSFWHEIRDGKMAMEDLNKVLMMGGKMTQGQRAFAGTQILAEDPAFKGMFDNMDPLTAEQAVKRVLMGNPLWGEGDVSKKELNARRDRAIQAIFKSASAQGDAAGTTQGQKDALRGAFLRAFTPVDFSNLAPDMEQTLIKEIGEGHLTTLGEEAMRIGMTDPTVDNLMNIGKELRRLDTSPLKKIMDTVQEIVIVLGAGFMSVVSALLNPLDTLDGTNRDYNRYAAIIRGHTPGLRDLYEMMDEDGSTSFRTPEALNTSGQAEARQYLSNAKFSSREQFEKAMLNITGGKTRSTKQGWMDVLEAGSLKTTLEGNLVFDFGNFGTYDVVVQDGKAVAVSPRMPKSGMMNPTATPTPTAPTPTLAAPRAATLPGVR